MQVKMTSMQVNGITIATFFRKNQVKSITGQSGKSPRSWHTFWAGLSFLAYLATFRRERGKASKNPFLTYFLKTCFTGCFLSIKRCGRFCGAWKDWNTVANFFEIDRKVHFQMIELFRKQQYTIWTLRKLTTSIDPPFIRHSRVILLRTQPHLNKEQCF